ncbi:hypothetical protein ACFYSW_28655 [Rhodococcus aetherivorans]|uniref:hypothetical protein n=1 Tax=Rhodococcus aetherivorans TaxID=191292 RepID=UPI0036B285F1
MTTWTPWIPIVVVLVASSVAFSGHVYNQWANRRQQTSQKLADAIAAVNDYKDLPFRVRRRPYSSPEIRWQLSERGSEIHSRMDFHLAWLAIVSPEVADHYKFLVETVRREAGDHIKLAWKQPLIAGDSEMNAALGDQYTYNVTSAAQESCIAAMRSYVHARWPFRHRTGMRSDRLALNHSVDS